jgi:hypothetical protein
MRDMGQAYDGLISEATNRRGLVAECWILNFWRFIKKTNLCRIDRAAVGGATM